MRGTVDFGIHIGTRGCLTSRESVMAVAQRAEALGYAYLGVADHLIVPMQTGVRYPYTADGIWPGAPTGECFDCIATLAFLAGCTQRLKLLTSVAVVPHRPAVLAAKLFMTADVLSGGRVIAGVGTGWMREEFEALGAPPFAERGAVTDEYLDAWRTLWSDAQPALDGKYAKFSNVVFAPKPASRPHLPIWVGGESAPALRRTVKYGDAWYPVSNNQSIRLNTPARLREGIEGLHRVAEKAVAILARSMSAICGSARLCGARSRVPTGGSCSAAVHRTCWRTWPPWRRPEHGTRSSICNGQPSRRRWT